MKQKKIRINWTFNGLAKAKLSSENGLNYRKFEIKIKIFGSNFVDFICKRKSAFELNHCSYIL